MNFKNSKVTRILSTSQPAVRPSSASATALEFLHKKLKVIVSDLRNSCSEEHLFKGEKLAKGVNKLVGKVSINLLRHAKSAICIISIIIVINALYLYQVSS